VAELVDAFGFAKVSQSNQHIRAGEKDEQFQVSCRFDPCPLSQTQREGGLSRGWFWLILFVYSGVSVKVE